jgi:hypothetical protein
MIVKRPIDGRPTNPTAIGENFYWHVRAQFRSVGTTTCILPLRKLMPTNLVFGVNPGVKTPPKSAFHTQNCLNHAMGFLCYFNLLQPFKEVVKLGVTPS